MTRLGFLLPPGNPTIEPEMIALAPAGVSLHTTRNPCASRCALPSSVVSAE